MAHVALACNGFGRRRPKIGHAYSKFFIPIKLQDYIALSFYVVLGRVPIYLQTEWKDQMLIRRMGTLLVFFTCCAQYVVAQSDYTKHELGGVVSIIGADTKGAFNNDESRDGLYGFNIQSAYNISRFLGLKADFSYFQKQFEAGNVDLTSRLFQIMGGIKLQDNTNNTRLRPFAQALIGVAHTTNFPRVLPERSSGRTVAAINGTGLAFALGGGLDIRLIKKLEIRVLQIDYNPARIRGENFQNVRLGIGLNFRF